MDAATKPATANFHGGVGEIAAAMSSTGPIHEITGLVLVCTPGSGPQCMSTPMAKAVSTM
jgi:hypothetical protein